MSSPRYQQIVRTSATLFREKGYSSTSIRDIGDALGITSAALYHHFKNKEELLTAIMMHSLTAVRQAVEEAIAGETLPWERIRAALRAHLRISVEGQDFAIVVLQDRRHLSEASRQRVIEERDAYERLWATLFSAAQQADFIRADVDLRLLRLMMFGSMNLVVTWYRPSGRYSLDEIADSFFEFVRLGAFQEPLL